MIIYTKRQFEVLDLTSRGRTKKEIMLELNISNNIVTSELKKLRHLNECRSTYELCYKFGKMQGMEGD